MTVTENGKRRPVTKREAVVAQLVNKSASVDLRATKMLIDMLRDIEKKHESGRQVLCVTPGFARGVACPPMRLVYPGDRRI